YGTRRSPARSGPSPPRRKRAKRLHRGFKSARRENVMKRAKKKAAKAKPVAKRKTVKAKVAKKAAKKVAKKAAKRSAPAKRKSSPVKKPAVSRNASRAAADGTVSWNFKLLAHHMLDGFGGIGEGTSIQIAPDGRRILWLAHESAPKNFTAVDVSDPRKPK